MPAFLERRRAIAFAGRTVLWAALGLLLVRGTIDLVQPDATTTSAANDAGGETVAGGNGVDVDAAEAFAVRFTTQFLTLDNVDPERRRIGLESYVATGIELDDRWDATGVQAVRDAVPVSTTVGDDDRMTVLVAAQVDGSRWLHLEVPVAGDDESFVVTGLPALVGSPTTADVDLAEATVDPDLSADLRPTVESFLAAYGAGDQAALERYVLPGYDLAGLGGTFVVDNVAAVDVLDPGEGATGGGPQRALTTVRWLDPSTGAAFSASYSIRLVEQGGRWYVDQLTAAQG